MLIVQGKLISNDVVEQQFICNLKACKGACCWEGDWGAPIKEDEIEKLKKGLDEIKPYLTEEGLKVIEEKGVAVYNKEPDEMGTSLLGNGACAFMTYQDGIAKCGIEKAYEEGKTEFKKPMSCHLYPIRVSENEATGFEALNYDRWDICSAACALGKEHQLPVYQFLKEPLIRKYGADFYEELDAAAKYYLKEITDAEE